MAKNIAKAVTNLAGDVWSGMSKGASKGKQFRVSGTKTANNAIKKVNTVNRVGKSNLKNVSGAKAPRVSKAATMGAGDPSMARRAGNWVGGGMRDTYKNMNGTGASKQKMGLKDAARAAHSNADGSLSMKKMAGTFVGASAVGRVASGGGALKDKNGNTNIIGIPFI